MLRLLILLLIFAFIIGTLLVSVYFGYVFGKRKIKSHPKHKLEILTVAESSVFALLALLIAFTFSGAFDRFESRKIQLLTQANAFDRALYYVDFTNPEYRSILRNNIIKYMNLHLDAYHDIPHMSKVSVDLKQALELEQTIWKMAVVSAENIKNQSLGQSFIDAISNLFEEAHTGINTTKMHAPAIIFLLMIGLAALGAFLIGYDSAETKQKQPLHISFYVLLTAVTIFVIINLEFPRIGFISSSNFDQLITDVRDHTNNFASFSGV